MSHEGRLLNGRTLLLTIIMVLLWGTTIFFIFWSQKGSQHATSRWNPESQRTIANKLKSVGLTKEAIAHYEAYLREANVSPESLASIAYTVGTMYMDVGNYEKALAWFYKAEIADPGSSLKDQLSTKIVNCLERLQRFSAAQYALDSRSGTERAGEETKVSGQVVARIGNEEITLSEIDSILDSMPPGLKEQFEAPEKKEEFLRQYVAEELLYRKALKLELENDPMVRKQMEHSNKKILVGKVLDEELKDKIKVEEDDLINYFLANKKNYEEKQRAKISLIKSGMSETAKQLAKKIEAGEDFSALAKAYSLDEESAERGGRWKDWAVEGEDSLGIGYVDEVSEAIFSLKKGEVSGLKEIGEYFYVFRMDDYKPAREREFEEVKEQVARDYYASKVQKAYHALLDQVLQTEEVKFYPEVIANTKVE